MKGGLLLSEINKCIPNGEQQMKELGSQVIDLPTQVQFFYLEKGFYIFVLKTLRSPKALITFF